jgi:hypothetical protein
MAHVAGDLNAAGSAVRGAVEHHALAAVRAVPAVTAATVTATTLTQHSSPMVGKGEKTGSVVRSAGERWKPKTEKATDL